MQQHRPPYGDPVPRGGDSPQPFFGGGGHQGQVQLHPRGRRNGMFTLLPMHVFLLLRLLLLLLLLLLLVLPLLLLLLLLLFVFYPRQTGLDFACRYLKLKTFFLAHAFVCTCYNFLFLTHRSPHSNYSSR